MYYMQSTSVFLDIAKVADFQWENADFSRTHGVCHVIYVFFGSSSDTKFHHCTGWPLKIHNDFSGDFPDFLG